MDKSTTSPPGCMVDGNPGSPLLIIGMAPGRDELRNDKPFIGGSGRQLWQQLSKKAGISRADCYIINCIGEWPQGSDGNPTREQFDRWWDVFDAAVSASRAKVALLLGRAALWRFTGIAPLYERVRGSIWGGGIEDWRGYLLEKHESQDLTRTVTTQGTYKTSNSKRGIRKGDPREIKEKKRVPAPWPETVRWAVPCLHPAAILRSGLRQLPALASDAARVGRALTGRLKFEERHWISGVPSEIKVYGYTPICVDIETGGVNNGIIERIGTNDSEKVWTGLWDNRARDALRWTLAGSQRGPSIAFNIGFDAPRLAAHGVPVPEPWWDVMLAAATCQPDLKKSLNFVASLYLDLKRWKNLSAEDPALYNAKDVAITLDLYPILRGELARTGQLELFEKRMMPTLPVLVDMTQHGIKVDEAARDGWVKELMTAREEALKEWEQIAPEQKTSGKKLLDWLYGELHLPVQYHKHGGITSEVAGIKKMLTQEHLEPRARRTLELLLVLRGVEKELRTYAEVELGEDGRIHPSFLPAGKDDDAFGKGIAGTGRITASGPNIQNQPQVARRMYVPSDRAMVLLEADYSQIEARIIAELSGDEVLKAAIAAGLHAANADALGVDKTRAKNGFYGWAYGAGKRTLHNTFMAKGYNIPEAECEQILRGFDHRFARAAAWRRRVIDEAAQRYYLTNAFGRRRYFLGGGRDAPAALDFLPQSSAADVLWTVLRPLADRLRTDGGTILAAVHDSVLIECPAVSVAACSRTMREVMEQPWPELGGLRVPIELKTGHNWAEMN